MGTLYRDAELSEYMIHNIAKNESGEQSGVLYNYYLYIHPKGSAIIMRENSDETEYRYANGGTADNKWANRQNLTYVTYDVLA